MPDYYYTVDEIPPADAARVLTDKVRKLAAAFVAVGNEANKIRNTANARGIPWGRNLEMMLAHLSIDSDYIAAELRELIE